MPRRSLLPTLTGHLVFDPGELRSRHRTHELRIVDNTTRLDGLNFFSLSSIVLCLLTSVLGACLFPYTPASSPERKFDLPRPIQAPHLSGSAAALALTIRLLFAVAKQRRTSWMITAIHPASRADSGDVVTRDQFLCGQNVQDDSRIGLSDVGEEGPVRYNVYDPVLYSLSSPLVTRALLAVRVPRAP